MEKRRLGLSSALRGWAVRLGLLSLGVFAGACTGVEADVLSLRPVADLAAETSDGLLPADGAGSSCTTQTLSTQGCAELAVWLAKAQSVCSSLGLVPGQLVLTSPCEMMKGQGVRFDCCPPPAPSTCTPRLQGDAMSCREPKTWLHSATLDCQSRMEQARLLVLLEPCAPRRYRRVKYQCCVTSQVPAALPDPLP